MFTATTAVAGVIEERCGWLNNPTPGNVWLYDRAGEWLLSVQGGYSADVIAWPEFDADDETQYVRTGHASYGYGCACLTGQIDKEKKRFESVTEAEVFPLSRCRATRLIRGFEEEAIR